MKTKLVALLTLIFLFTNTFAGDEKLVKDLRARTFIGVLLEEDPAIIKKFAKKPLELAEYKKNIKLTNDNFKIVLTKYWKLNATVQFKTLTEIDVLKAEIAKDKKNKGLYAFMRMDYYSYKGNSREESQLITSQEYTSDINYLRVYFLDGTELSYSSLPNVLPTMSDLIYGVRHLSNTLIGMEYGRDLTALTEENCPQIRDKTLLVTQEQMGDLPAKDFVKAYPFPYKIATQAEIDKAVLANDLKFAYLVSADQSDSVVMKMIVLTSTGQWAGYIVNNGRSTLNKTELKELIKACK